MACLKNGFFKLLEDFRDKSTDWKLLNKALSLSELKWANKEVFAMNLYFRGQEDDKGACAHQGLWSWDSKCFETEKKDIFISSDTDSKTAARDSKILKWRSMIQTYLCSSQEVWC
jgi:hypothetical protein